MSNKKAGVKNIFKLFTAGAVASAVLLLCFAVKGIWPFGDLSVATQDMAHGYLPVYYHLYDALHGEKSLWFDFYTGTGVNMAGIVSANGLLCPSNLILLLFPRDMLLEAMGILLIFKIFLCGFSAQWFFSKRFPSVPYFWQTTFALLYALSGFTLYYYFHLIWLDVVFVFPFIVYSAELLFKKGRLLPLIASLTFALCASLYMGGMVIICLFFIGGLYVFTLLDKKERKPAVLRLGIATVLSIALSLFINLPAYLQMSGSSRYQNSKIEAADLGIVINRDKVMLFLGLQVCVFLIALLVSKYEKCKKETAFLIGSAAFLFAPYFLEGTDLLWHFGSYESFSMRFAFMSIFFIITAAVYYVSAFGEEALKPAKSEAMKVISAAVSVIGLCGFTYLLYLAYQKLGTKTEAYNKTTITIFIAYILYIAGIALLIFIFKQHNKNARRAFVLLFVLLQSFALSMTCIGEKTKLRFARAEHDVSYVELCENVCDELSKLSENSVTTYDALDRVKNTDMSLNINYGFLVKRSTVSNWTHQIPNDLQNSVEAMGYSSTYTLMLDNGGTAFGEALLGVKQRIKTTKDGEAVISASPFTLPSGMVVSEDFVNTEIQKYHSGCFYFLGTQNRLYSALGGEGDLFDIITEPTKESGKELRYSLNLKEKKTVYIAFNGLANNSLEIKVNGKQIKFPYYTQRNYTFYPSEYYRGFGCLGSYKGKVEIVMTKHGVADGQTIRLELMSEDGLKKLCEKKNAETVTRQIGKRTMDFAVSADKGGYFFVPVCIDDGWKCEVNGKKVEIMTAAGSFMAVPLDDGENEISFKFTPKGLKTGTLCSIITLFITAAFVIINRKKLLDKLPGFIVTFVYYCFTAVYIIAVVGVYLAPLAASFIIK